VDGFMSRSLKRFVLVGALLATTPAFAANGVCDSEIAPFMAKKAAIETQLVAINKQAKQPGAREKFCSAMVGYIGNLRNLADYMAKNQDFCGMPDEQIGQVNKGLASNITLRKKICSGPPPQARPAQGGGPSMPPPPVSLKLL
jgi:hypothetical protein